MRNRLDKLDASTKRQRTTLESFELIKSGKLVCLSKQPSELALHSHHVETFMRTSDGFQLRDQVQIIVYRMCLKCCRMNSSNCRSGSCDSCWQHENKYQALEQTKNKNYHSDIIVALMLGIHFGITDIRFWFSPTKHIGKPKQRTRYSARIRSKNMVIAVDTSFR